MAGEERFENFTGFAGRRIHWIWETRSPGGLQYVSVFVSKAMQEVFSPVVEFREQLPPRLIGRTRDGGTSEQADSVRITMYALTARTLTGTAEVLPALREPLKEILEEENLIELDPERMIPQALIRSLAEDDVSVIYVILPETAEEAQIGTLDDHGEDERQMRAKQSGLSNDPADGEYSGPLYVYAVDRSLDQGRRYLERRAPVNIIWERRDEAFGVNLGAGLRRSGWDGADHPVPVPTPQGHSHVLVANDSVVRPSGFDDSATKDIDDDPPFAQWHCRLFDIPETMDETHSVAGSAHRDPVDHGLFRRHLQAEYPKTKRVLDAAATTVDRVIGKPPYGRLRQIARDVLIGDWRRNQAREEVEQPAWTRVSHRIQIPKANTVDSEFDGEASVLELKTGPTSRTGTYQAL